MHNIFILQYVYFMPLHVSSICAHHQEVKIALHRLWYHHTETSEWSKITKIQFYKYEQIVVKFMCEFFGSDFCALLTINMLCLTDTLYIHMRVKHFGMANIKLITRDPPPVCIEQLSSYWQDFHEIWYLNSSIFIIPT